MRGEGLPDPNDYIKKKCIHCEALDEALDVLTLELQKERRKKRALYLTIRLLKAEVQRNLESEHELEHEHEMILSPEVCQGDFEGYDI